MPKSHQLIILLANKIMKQKKRKKEEREKAGSVKGSAGDSVGDLDKCPVWMPDWADLFDSYEKLF